MNTFLYDAYNVYSSRPPFKLLGTINHPLDMSVKQVIRAAAIRFAEPAPVLEPRTDDARRLINNLNQE